MEAGLVYIEFQFIQGSVYMGFTVSWSCFKISPLIPHIIYLYSIDLKTIFPCEKKWTLLPCQLKYATCTTIKIVLCQFRANPFPDISV
jgi:hypothetical protein